MGLGLRDGEGVLAVYLEQGSLTLMGYGNVCRRTELMAKWKVSRAKGDGQRRPVIEETKVRNWQG